MPVTKNIDFMMQMTQDFISGVIDPISYDLDFSYEIEIRFKAMRREHREWADLIYDRLYEDGVAKMHEKNLSSDAFKTLIKTQYTEHLQYYEGRVLLSDTAGAYIVPDWFRNSYTTLEYVIKLNH